MTNLDLRQWCQLCVVCEDIGVRGTQLGNLYVLAGAFLVQIAGWDNFGPALTKLARRIMPRLQMKCHPQLED